MVMANIQAINDMEMYVGEIELKKAYPGYGDIHIKYSLSSTLKMDSTNRLKLGGKGE